MNTIIFKTIKVKNVLSVGEEVFYDYRNAQGLTYVYGVHKYGNNSNGAGKSTIFVNCILIALFGKTINNSNNAFIFNHNVSWKETGYIDLEFDKLDINNNSWRIYVEVKTTKKRNACTLTYSLYKNGENVTKASKAETLKYIELLLGCNFETFKNTIIISSSNIINFFQMPKALKDKYLQSIFSLETCNSIYTAVLTILNDIKFNIKSDSDKLNFLIKNDTVLNDKLQYWEKQKQSEIQKLNLQIEECAEQISKFSKDNNTKVLDIDKIESKLALKPKIQKKRDLVSEKLSEIKNNISVYSAKLNANDKLNKKYTDIISILCKDCKEKVQKAVGIEDTDKCNLDYTNKIEVLRKEESKAKELLTKLDSDLKKINNLETKFNNYKISLNNRENKLNSINSTKNFYLNEVKAKEQAINPFINLINDNKIETDTVQTSLNEFIEKQQYYGILKEVFSDSGVKKILLNNIIPVLNNNISNYLNKMNANFTVQFDLSLQYEFFSSFGQCEYSSFSAGERKKLDLAVLLAFRDILFFNALKTNICVIDEILDGGIDEPALNCIINIFKDKSKESNQSIFIISHRNNQVQMDVFDHVIRIEKDINSILIQEY